MSYIAQLQNGREGREQLRNSLRKDQTNFIYCTISIHRFHKLTNPRKVIARYIVHICTYLHTRTRCTQLHKGLNRMICRCERYSKKVEEKLLITLLLNNDTRNVLSQSQTYILKLTYIYRHRGN